MYAPKIDAIRVDEICIPDGREAQENRPLIEGLKQSIRRRGLLAPIRLRFIWPGRYELVCGLQRLMACKELNHGTIDAIVCEGDAVDIELDEIEENLLRREITVLERAILEARQKELYLQKHPGTAKGKAGASARWMQAKQISFAATQAGSKRMVEQRIQIATALTPEEVTRLASRPIARNHTQLLELARTAKNTRSQVVDLLASGDAATVGHALAIIDTPKEEPGRTKKVRGKPQKMMTAKLHHSPYGYTASVVVAGRKVVFNISPDLDRVEVHDMGREPIPDRIPRDDRPLTVDLVPEILSETVQELPGDLVEYVSMVGPTSIRLDPSPSGYGAGITIAIETTSTTVKVEAPGRFSRAVKLGGSAEDLRRGLRDALLLAMEETIPLQRKGTHHVRPDGSRVELRASSAR